MSINCEILDLKSKPTIIINTKIPQSRLDETKKNAYNTMYNYLKSIGKHNESEFFIAYKSMGIENLDVDFGYILENEIESKNEIMKDELPSGKYVSGTYSGDYNKIESVYEELMMYANEKGYETLGVIYEIDVNDQNKEEKRLKLMLPLKNKSKF
ncbi:MAG: GyrI-like domain-containing protein [Clostridiales bacterium]